jgi:hypothetical protein
VKQFRTHKAAPALETTSPWGGSTWPSSASPFIVSPRHENPSRCDHLVFLRKAEKSVLPIVLHPCHGPPRSPVARSCFSDVGLSTSRVDQHSLCFYRHPVGERQEPTSVTRRTELKTLIGIRGPRSSCRRVRHDPPDTYRGGSGEETMGGAAGSSLGSENMDRSQIVARPVEDLGDPGSGRRHRLRRAVAFATSTAYCVAFLVRPPAWLPEWLRGWAVTPSAGAEGDPGARQRFFHGCADFRTSVYLLVTTAIVPWR